MSSAANVYSTTQKKPPRCMEPKRSLPVYKSPSGVIQSALLQPITFKFDFNIIPTPAV